MNPDDDDADELTDADKADCGPEFLAQLDDELERSVRAAADAIEPKGPPSQP